MSPRHAVPFLALLLALGPAAGAKEELIPTDPERRQRQEGPPNPLREVSDDMVAAARRLQKILTGDETQDIQKAILDKLDQLVEQARKQQQQQQPPPRGQGGSQKKQRQPKQPQPQPASAKQKDEPKEQEKPDRAKAKQQQQQQSKRPGIGRPGQGRGEGRLHTDAEEWGMLPPAIREQLLQTRGEGFPLRYRELLRRYYRELAKPRE